MNLHFKYFVIGIFIMSGYNLTAANSFLQGAGTIDDPYLINSVDELKWMRNQINDGNSTYRDKHYKLVCDLDFTDEEDWISIGNCYDNAFRGSFNGNRKVIRNLNIKIEDLPYNPENEEVLREYEVSLDCDRVNLVQEISEEDWLKHERSSKLSYLGLFGMIELGEVKDLGIIWRNLSSLSSSFLGGIAGRSSGNITNCYSTGNISLSYNKDCYAGGIVGWSSGNITNCYSTGNIVSSTTSTSFSGGIAGRSGGNVTNCYSTGRIESTSSRSYSGGIIGYTIGSVANCYSAGNIISTSTTWSYSGGIAGYSGGIVSYCYALNDSISSINAMNKINIGRIIGAGKSTLISNLASSGIVITSGVSKNQLVITNDSFETKYGELLTQDVLSLLNHYVRINRCSSYGILLYQWGDDSGLNNGFPFLNQNSPSLSFDLEGNGTQDYPYLIWSNDDLWKLSIYVNTDKIHSNKYYKLMADLDFSKEPEWIPIGTQKYMAFKGEFDGNGKSLKNFKIGTKNKPVHLPYTGIFGVIEEGIVKNLSVDSLVSNTKQITFAYSSDSYSGGIVGFSTGNIIDCYTTSTINSYSYESSYSGGITGYTTGDIINCYASGNLSAYSLLTLSYSGMITGGSSGNLINCYANANIFATNCSGGIVGYSTGNIANCYVSGSVSADSYCGGITGYSTGIVTDCYATANVFCSSSTLLRTDFVPTSGGIVGYATGSVTNCFATGNVSIRSALSSYSGGITGYSSGSIVNCSAQGDISSFSISPSTLETYFSYSGGIVGYSEGNVVDCYALSRSIHAIAKFSDDAHAHRIGYNKGGNFITNYASNKMDVMTGNSESTLSKIIPVGKNHGNNIIGVPPAFLTKSPMRYF